jgi:hypothetical protein
MTLGAGGRVLKPDAPYPGDPRVDSQWTAVEVPPVHGPARIVPLRERLSKKY